VRRSAVMLLCAFVLGSGAAHAQSGVASGIRFQGYDFAEGFAAEAANLMWIPIALDHTVMPGLRVDAYTAYARGAANFGGTEYTLNGLVDTRVRLNWTVRPWAVVTVGANVPTGNPSHDPNEARVASMLSTELLGFQEANFGLGFATTTGVATAYRSGDYGLGFGASYRAASGFEPSADTAVTYTPGDELRLRVALDRDFGGNRFTLGGTFQTFRTDELDGRNLYQSGKRWRGDVSYSFRTSANATWTAFVSDVYRDRGDAIISYVDGTGTARDSTFQTGYQNIVVGGVRGSWRLSPALTIRPMVDARIQTREQEDGEGWLVGAGGDVPLRWGIIDVFPSARAMLGSLSDAAGDGHRVLGAELGLTMRWGR
jgi:hypothetical protein